MVTLKQNKMKKLIFIVFLFFSISSIAQIGDLYIYNFSSVDIKYQLAAFNTNGGTCYPAYTFNELNMPSSAGFTIHAGKQQVFHGFTFPTANFPAGNWNYSRRNGQGTGGPIPISPANAQDLSGKVISPYQARWKYFKWITSDGSFYGGLGFSSNCLGGISPTEENDAIILNMMTIGDNTVITIDDN